MRRTHSPPAGIGRLDRQAPEPAGPPHPEDAQLVASLRSNPERALAEVYCRNAAAVFGLARRLLTDPAVAEEVTEDVFLRLSKEPGRFDARRGSLRSHLLTDCRRRSVAVIRAEVSGRVRADRAATGDRPTVESIESVTRRA